MDGFLPGRGNKKQLNVLGNELEPCNFGLDNKSSPIFPRAAEIPPCAAEVWLLVGKTFEMQAVFNPASLKPTAALKPEPPAPRTTTSYSWSIIL